MLLGYPKGVRKFFTIVLVTILTIFGCDGVGTLAPAAVSYDA